MELITRKCRASTAADRWNEQYKNEEVWGEKQKTTKLLRKLGKNPNPDDVDIIIGNDTWISIPCSECGDRGGSVVRLGQEPDYDSETVWICEKCLLSALRLIVESASGAT